MKRNFKFLIIFMVAVLLLVGCKKDGNSPQVDKDSKSNSVVENSKNSTAKNEDSKEDKDDKEISEEFLNVASKLGVDPHDTNKKAFIIFLGSMYDEKSLKEVLEKLYPLEKNFLNGIYPKTILVMKKDESGKTYLMGEECYLIIPKYKNASISLKELELSEDGNLKEAANEYLDGLTTTGATFICQNISDIAPNGKIIIRDRDDTYEFSPSISLKDGSLMLPDEIIDGEEILDWEKEIEEGKYSTDLFEKINPLLDLNR
ncbi:hypothetical protein [Peptoniphilus duerdenii]|uniref:hypothetical protein n=1 Tax=Peptoniphilus duerdenii TaxID=507750 RepID=UPI0028891422|nr:hypothetical protein [Peptoniphilus duerdenii]